MFDRLTEREPLFWRMEGKSGNQSSRCVVDRYGNRDHPLHEFAVVRRVSAFPDFDCLGYQVFRVGDRRRRSGLEIGRHCVVSQMPSVEAAQVHFSAGRAVERHAGPYRELNAQQPFGLDPVEIYHGVPVGNRDVARLADLACQFVEDGDTRRSDPQR